jgi:tight adherence protein B
MALLVGVLTFLSVAVICIAAWLFFTVDTAQEVVRQRIEAVHKAERRGQVSVDLQLVRNELYSNVPLLHRLLMRVSWSGRLNEFLAQAGMKVKPGKILLVSAVCGLGGYLLMTPVTRLPLVAVAVGVAGVLIPISVVAFKRGRRLRQFEERFPDALDLLGRAVRAGHAFTTGLEMVSKETSEPVAGEFRKTFEEQNFGLPLRDALINMTERVPVVDVRFLVTALLIQKETGGNLAEILDELARVIRERFRIYREVRVKTAQGRLTAMILVALPLVMMIVMEMLNPAYMKVLFTDPIGPTILGIAAAMQIVGSLVLWKIVHIAV